MNLVIPIDDKYCSIDPIKNKPHMYNMKKYFEIHQ